MRGVKNLGDKTMDIERVTFSALNNNLHNFIANILPKQIKKYNNAADDEFTSTNSEPRSSEARTNSAVKKSNEANNNRLIAEINRSAEPDSSFYEMLLPGYAAYKNPELSDLNFLPENTISATYKGKPVQIKISDIDDEKEIQEINFVDGSHICYVTFLKEGKMSINEEEFDMPTGTIVESKFVNDRMFSQLIQLPDMTKKVVAKPEYLSEKQV